jgi:hypothetical protein
VEKAWKSIIRAGEREFVMNPASDKQVSPQGAGEGPITSPFTSPEDLLGFARSYYADDFPNPERRGCPPPADLDSRARSGQLPDEHLRAHLFGCSECFRAYRSALAARAATLNARPAPDPLPVERSGAPRSRTLLPAFAGALSLLILLFVGIYFWRQYRPAPDDIIIRKDPPPTAAPADTNSNSVVGPATPPSPLRTPQQKDTPRRRAAPHRQEPGTELAAVTSVGIDLQKYVITRGGEAARTDEVIELPRARVRLLLKLPEGSDAGVYTVSIIDSSGKAVVTAPRAGSADGKNLSVTINTTRLAPKKYTLRVLRQGAMAEFYPLILDGHGAATP